jgi:hypothetical protein
MLDEREVASTILHPIRSRTNPHLPYTLCSLMYTISCPVQGRWELSGLWIARRWEAETAMRAHLDNVRESITTYLKRLS